MVTPAGLVTGCAYDAAGRLISTTDPRGWITRYEYNKRGDKTAVICPSGAVTSYRYDAAGQLTEIIDANGSVTQYRYDSAGNVSSIADAKGAVIRYAYDGARRLTAVTDPLGRTTSYGYDAAGNLTEITDPSGRAMHLAYDADGRLVQKTADNAVSVSYTYNGIGQRISMTDGTGITRYSYDAAGRLVTVTEPDGAETTAGYDAAGQRTSLSYPGGLVVDYGYDGNGRLTSLRDSRSGAAAYALDADGRLLTEQLPGRHSRRYHYLGGLLHEFAVFRDDHAVMTTSLAHDPDGRIASQCDRDHVRDYRYDPVGQLISIVRRQRAPGTAARRPESEAHELHIVYDVVGNRIRLKEGSRETHYSCDVADQLLATETAGRRTEFSYDSSGRLTGRSEGGRRTVIEYDGFGQPATVTQTVPGMTEKVRPTFNGDRLVTALVVTRTNERAEDEHSASVRYIWGGVKQIPQILSQHAATDLDDAERDHRAEVAADFSYGYGRTFVSSARDAAHEAGTFYRDVFGSAIRTEETEDWVQAAGYDAFGAPEASGAPGDDGRRLGLPRFGYRGELADGDLTYLRARSYDATLGRFTSPDPLSASARPSQIENPYPYCANDPLNLTDPLGKFILVPGGYGGNTTLNPWSKITTLHAAENLNWQQALLGKLVPNSACGTSSGDCWASDSFITAAVNYATQAGVDPALVLAIAMKESSGRSATIGALPNEILNQLGVFCHNESPINCWPRPGGASLGFTNIKPATFNLVQNAFPAQFRGVQWANLVGNANLDIKTTAYYLKFIDESVIPSASLPIEQRYTPTQVIEGVYNLGIQNYNTYVVPAGKFGPMVTGYINSIAPDYALARNLICGIGAYTCSGGGWQQESAPTIPPFISPLGPSVPVGPGGGTLYQA
jgi:RHS repeat-associated protein